MNSSNPSNKASPDQPIFDAYGKYISPTYPAFLKKLGLDRVAAKATGATITDSAGRTYIDCVGGYGLFNLGHNHPEVVKALKEQLDKEQLFTRPLITDVAVELAEKMVEITSGELTCMFLCNSGSEAIDSAIKLARLCTRKPEIITAENSFHGYTFGALSASGILSFKKLFEPMVPGVRHVPYGNVKALKDTINEKTAAVLLEPIQHEAGILLPPEGYLAEVRRLCDNRSVLLILDEIKTGFGKTGSMFAYEHFQATPDILVLGKSLGGGLVPAGTLVAKPWVWRKFGLSFSMSASSFSGNVMASRAALTAIRIFQENGFLNNCREKGIALLKGLREKAVEHTELIKDVSGLGFLLGIELNPPYKALGLAREMIQRGVLALPAYGNPSVLMIEPPLVISSGQIDAVIHALAGALKKLERAI